MHVRLSVKAKIFPRHEMCFSLILSAWQKECWQLVLISNAMLHTSPVFLVSWYKLLRYALITEAGPLACYPAPNSDVKCTETHSPHSLLASWSLKHIFNLCCEPHLTSVKQVHSHVHRLLKEAWLFRANCFQQTDNYVLSGEYRQLFQLPQQQREMWWMGFKQVMNCEIYCITNLHVMALIIMLASL